MDPRRPRPHPAGAAQNVLWPPATDHYQRPQEPRRNGSRSGGEVFVPITVPHGEGVGGQVPHRRHPRPHLCQNIEKSCNGAGGRWLGHT